MAETYCLTTEIFAIPYRGDAYLLYSPLKGILMLANEGTVDLVASLRDGTFEGPTGENMDALELLIDAGAVNGSKDEPPVHAAATTWKPTEVTLFLTNACNLRCTYCYASAGDYGGTMDESTAIAAVELVARNAVEQGTRSFRVSYHGGGEPTLAWKTLTASVERAEALARAHALDLSLNLATNGVLPAWKVDWLVRHIHEYSISYDGPPAVQDRHRPTVSGGGSAETVEATLRHLDSHGARYGLRLTVTAESVDCLDQIVTRILHKFSPSTLHLEPLFSHGRAETRGLAAPHARTFVENFRKAQQVAQAHGMDLYYSGARTELITDTFCGVPDGSFNVTPEGLLTSCFEVCHPDDELAGEFFYGGRKAGEGAEFTVNPAQLKRLAAHTVRERPECASCFCKWHCAGDCIAKNMAADRRPGASMKAARCLINQELSRDHLIARLKSASRVMAQVEANAASTGEPLVQLGRADDPALPPALPRSTGSPRSLPLLPEMTRGR